VPEPLNIVFFGSDPIALPLLEWLAGEGASVGRVTAVFTQPDRPVGRGQKITANGIKTWALSRDLPVYQPEKLTEDVRLQLSAMSADVGLIMAYGHILKQAFIDTPRLGTLNLHTSLLPKYRGASPIQTAVANGERETGVSLMRIVKQLDAGPVADAGRVTIGSHDTALEVETKLAAACVPLLARALPKLAAGELVFAEQNHAAATFCRKLVKEDGVLDFNESASALAARINGLFPWPACSVEIAGQSVKIGLADVGDGSGAPGEVLGADDQGLRVATGAGVVRFLRMQRPGGKMLSTGEFLRGFAITPGTRLAARPMPGLITS